MTASVKRVGASGQNSLDKEFAGRTRADREHRARGVADQDGQHIPDAELWLHQPEAANRLDLSHRP
jgi:hypothetical protein